MDAPAAAVLVAAGSVVSIGFGVWHFFVPSIWRWYSYIDAAATELVLAVRAVNVFFSLSLVLFGGMNLLMTFGAANRYARSVVCGATAVLWLARVVMQIVHPQGSVSVPLRYGFLALAVAVLAAFSTAFALLLARP